MPDDRDTAYVNSISYKDWETKIVNLVSAMDENTSRNVAARRLRYTEVDVEAEKKAQNLAPDEVYVPQHIIDTNIRREQPGYIQYITQSPRAVILVDANDPAADTSIIERDATNRIRYDNWQLPMYANIDGFQQNGYSVMELVDDQTKPGEVSHEAIQFGDFGIIMDTRDIQAAEIVSRKYYFSKTKLLALVQDPQSGWSADQVKKVIDGPPSSTDSADGSVTNAKDRSLYCVQKVMFRVNGVVMVAWVSKERADDWLRQPRELFIGRRELITDPITKAPVVDPVTGLPQSKPVPEVQYPYYLFPYLISENNTISQLKGRAYLDQDTQEAATSLTSSFCTSQRRAAGFYASKDSDDPNADVALQKNVFLKQGMLINSKIKQWQMVGASSDIMGAVAAIVSANQNETSQVNFAVNNRKDSRKTAKEIETSENQEQKLSTVQVVLYSSTLRALFQTMFEVIQSRVVAGLITVTPDLLAMYQKKYIVKPSGDVDVIERQKLITTMMNTWPVMKETAAGPIFLADLLSKLFPDTASKYIKVMQEAQQQQQSQQAQQQQMMIGNVRQMAAAIVNLSKHPEMFSDVGRVNAFPQIEMAANMLQQLEQQMGIPK